MIRRSAPALALLLLLGSCGYRLVDGIAALHGTPRLQVVPFDETSSIGLSAPMGQILCRLLAADGIHFSAGQQPAARLGGTLEVRTLPSASRAGVAAYQLLCTATAWLRDVDGHEVWRGSTTTQEDFLPPAEVDVQPLFTERNRRLAMLRLAERTARALHRLLQEAPARRGS